MDDIRPTFSQIGGGRGSAVVDGRSASQLGGRIDMVGTPAMLNYLDQISGELKRLNDEPKTEAHLAGLTMLLGANSEALKDIAAAIDSLPPAEAAAAPKVEVTLPELNPKINVYPSAETVTTFGKIERAIGICIAVILWGILTVMIDSQYSFLEKLTGGG